MKAFLKKASLAFASGCFAAIALTFVVWGLRKLAFSASAAGKFAAVFPALGVYRRVVWGGIWGFLFVLPALRGSILLRGVLFGLAPAVVHLFYVLPYRLDKGMLGLEMGQLTPIFVIVMGLAWGVLCALWLAGTGEK
ncbi:MAG: hypothetical protein V2A58_15270 [Planctomycetota bacterium]